MHPGAWITQNIELERPIAEGAMGRVWVGFHHRMKTRVAVKFVRDKLGDDTAEALARFDAEASVASLIRSPHVVQTFDSGLTHEGVPYIVMELLRGETLGQRIRRLGCISLLEAKKVLRHTAHGLKHAHAQGVVHRDIKPDNIFLCADDGSDAPDAFFCKLLDFGIAKQTHLPAMGGLTTDGKLVGTPEYMSPEQVLEDKAVDARADLWALAVVMYQALTGQLPFTGATLGQLCLNLVGKTPVKPTQHRGDLPRRVDAWFGRALNRDANMRFATAEEMAESFATLDDNMAFHMVPLGDDTERHLSSSRSLERGTTAKPGMALRLGGMLAAAGLLGAGAWLSLRPPEEPTILAQEALAPMITHAANRAVTKAKTPPPPKRKIIDLDEDDPPRSPEPRAAAIPRATTVATPQPAVAPPAANPPTPTPAPAPARKRGRTPGNTGF